MVGTVDLRDDEVDGGRVAGQTDGSEDHWLGRAGQQLGASVGGDVTMKGREVWLGQFWLPTADSAGPRFGTILGEINLEGPGGGASGEL